MELVRSLADGVSDDEAFSGRSRAPTSRVSRPPGSRPRRRCPDRHGPQPAPAGPLPPGWEAAQRAPRAAAGAGELRPLARPPSRHGRPCGGRHKRRRVAVPRGPGPASAALAACRGRGAGVVRPAPARRRPAGTGRTRDRGPRFRADPDVAGHPLRRAARAWVPDRRPGSRRGPAGPLHDAGARAARRDGGRPAGAAGSAQGPDPGAPRQDHGAEQGAAGSGALRDATSTTRSGRARIAAGLVALEGPGDRPPARRLAGAGPAGRVRADYRVGARDLRPVVEELWLAGAEAVSVNGERVVATTAFVDIGGPVLVNSAYLAPPYQVAAIGPTGPVRRPGLGRPASSSCPGARGPLRDPVLLRGAGQRDRPGLRGSVSLRYARPPGASPHAGALTMRQPGSQLALTAMALLLGLLSCPAPRPAGGDGPGDPSSQDLTLLVANLNTRNDQLRARSPTSSASWPIAAASARGGTSVGQLRSDLERVRIWSGEDPAAGPGVRVLLSGESRRRRSPTSERAAEWRARRRSRSAASAWSAGGGRGRRWAPSIENTALGPGRGPRDRESRRADRGADARGRPGAQLQARYAEVRWR